MEPLAQARTSPATTAPYLASCSLRPRRAEPAQHHIHASTNGVTEAAAVAVPAASAQKLNFAAVPTQDADASYPISVAGKEELAAVHQRVYLSMSSREAIADTTQ